MKYGRRPYTEQCRFFFDVCSIKLYLENVLLRDGGLQVLDEQVGLGDVVLLQVVDHEVQARLGDHVHERGQHLHVMGKISLKGLSREMDLAFDDVFG
jgi:hypothetical protein